MGMDWLRGLVGASDQMVPAGQPFPGGQPYGAPPQAAPPQGAPPAFGAPQAGPPLGGVGQDAPTGWGAPPAPTPAWTPPSPPAGWGAPPPAWGASSPAASPTADPRVAALEARCAELRRDVDAIALFARTLLALLEEKQVVTEQQFAEARSRLDAQAAPRG